MVFGSPSVLVVVAATGGPIHDQQHVGRTSLGAEVVGDQGVELRALIAGDVMALSAELQDQRP